MDKKMDIIELFNQNKQIADWQRNLSKSTRQLLMGLSSSTKAVTMASCVEENHKILILTSTYSEAERLSSDLIELLGEEKVYTFLADDTPLAEFVFSSQEKIFSRLEALDFLLDSQQSGFLIVNVAASQLFLPDPVNFNSAYIDLKIGQEYELKDLIHQLSNSGYKQVSQVFNQGEFSLRGDILDIFERSSQIPFRVEFFGDEVDGIRLFNPENQISIQNVEHVHIHPATDIIFTKADYKSAQKKIENLIEKTVDSASKSYLEEILASTKEQIQHTDIRKLLSYFYQNEWTILDYLPKHSPIFFDDFQKIMNRHAQFQLEVANLLTEDLQTSKSVENQSYFADTYLIFRKYKPATFFSNFHKGLGNLKFDSLYQFNQYPMQEFFSQFQLLKEEISRYKKSNYTVIIQSNSLLTLQSLHKSLQEYEIPLDYVNDTKIHKHAVQLVEGRLIQGFNFVDEKIVLITEYDILQKKVKRKVRRQSISNAERLKNYNELEKGDYVVHNVHGIGRYLGIETIEISGIHRDYLTIQYQNADRISIPVDQIHLLSKYVASDGKAPKINKLNDGRFQKTKQRVQHQVEDIAEDLIKLYSERSQLKGFAFSSDDSYQQEFDNDFPYVETEDQLRSIKEVKKDMESDHPMDRLLVGDVGFGKTEVAMRAAFKAVNDHKQVAILVPTTVLAQQHYTNFKERFNDFPINIEVLSRFKSKSEQKIILEKLKKGQVDIIIGTHRLLSKDIVFADLGLIVIDEEQRFGVKHKEKLKELKTKVDVLTLTATPIPRTLHMSMLGIRDLSVIETPPTNRYPVQTYVLENNATVIRDAVLREMDRGGQVYYLYNKVDTMEQKVSELKELIPEASIGYVHGQMSEILLENTLLDFINGEYDILVTTTIIETGVDIPNVNTLFIENADYMGLSTLYQLRGRIGRSNRIAYAYLMYRPDKILTEISEKRLETIKGFTELGSGFKIAMRDLSIRGAGNILGSSQSGFIDSVGFEMYSQLLEEAIAKKQGKEKRRQKGNAEINLQIDAYLPSDYITDERQKIEIYKRIREIDNRVNYEELQNELIDRFGEYPDVVAFLLEIGLVKSYLDQAFVQLVEKKQQSVIVRFEKVSQQFFLTQDYFEALSVTNLKARISENKGLIEVIFDVKNKKDYEILEGLLQFSEKLVEIKNQKKNC
ncbi:MULTISPECIES: transcription-repair coupling factor [Streptococcus]|uniref:Transcription-repair-coupling factor n=2 Tax=Streptococcus TaxID=1301 RepID=E6J2V9_STRAP|nr:MULTISPECIES: transcription-repair coupling factor [Streptococcus]AIK76804.1 transcription-repair coupling factor [Streptococcus anginosus]EFU21804.1 transcription-repair coupling factor [Streptococcus anginosus F0211]MCY7212903.1 transcription-repair coupling factor [Streptococcus anginosus]MDX5006850.1 transcription-repair coupling factor [Streptococcus anginosus]MDX5055124.1 transcription-repair coupling factor [Streptococcus anginosus]